MKKSATHGTVIGNGQSLSGVEIRACLHHLGISEGSPGWRKAVERFAAANPAIMDYAREAAAVAERQLAEAARLPKVR